MTSESKTLRTEKAFVQRALDTQIAYAPHVCTSIGTPGEGWTTAEAFFSDEKVIDEFLAFEQSLNDGTDLRTAGALLMTDYGYILAAATVPLFAGFGLVADLAPSSVALSFYTFEEPHKRHFHRSKRAHVRFLTETFWHGHLSDAADNERFRYETERHFRPVVEVLHARTTLSKAALWRLAADAIAGQFLEFGRQSREVEAIKTAAMHILKMPGSPLNNRQLHYFDLTVLDKQDEAFSYTFRQRGGCCRYYLVKDGELCPTCVLKAPIARDEELRLAMRRHLGVI